MSAAIRLMPSRPRMMVRSSRVVQPPVSGVPVAGATIHLCQRCSYSLYGININTQIHRVLEADPLPDLLDDAISTNLVNFPGLDDLKAAVAVILIVRGSRQRRADAGVDVCVVRKKAFLRGVEEVSPVVDASLLTRSATKHLRLPRVTGNVLSDRHICIRKGGAYRWLSKWMTLIGPYSLMSVSVLLLIRLCTPLLTG
jgi:hypothetical protein